MGEVIQMRDYQNRREFAPVTRNIATEELRALDLYQFAASGTPPDVIYESSLGYLPPNEPA